MGCYNDEVLFIHIPKCGGTACKEYMYEHLPDVKWPRPPSWFARRAGRLIPNDEDKALATESVKESKLPIGHIPLRDIEAFTGRKPETWERIIIPIRNPYEQQASQWVFWRERYARGEVHVHDMMAARHPRLDSFVQDPESEFHRWYEHRMSVDTPVMKRHGSKPYAAYGGMYAYWAGVGEIIPGNVQFVRQENLNHEYPLALAPYMDGPPPDLHESNVGQSDRNYMQYYNTWEAVDAVEARFAWTFANDIYPRVER